MALMIQIVLGFLLSIITCFALPISRFIISIEENGMCETCKGKNSCIAKKKMFLSNSDYLDEWIVFSFFAVQKKCDGVVKGKNTEKFICCIVSFVLFLITFWSKGFGTIGFLCGLVAIMLLFLSVVDWNTQYIPLECNIFIFLCGLIHLFADFSNWVDYIIGLLAVSGFLLVIDKLVTPTLRKKYEDELEIDHVIGDGDIKLMAATGLLLGWKLNFLALGTGCIMGSIIHLILMKVKGSGRQFAFGPYLSLGVYITMICGEQLISWYLNMWV